MNSRKLGCTLKKIRVSKGMSQKEVIGNVVSQSNFSRFENGEIEVSASAFIEFLNTIDINLEEFLLFHNSSRANLRDEIITDFYALTYNNEDEIKKILDKIAIYIIQIKDVYIQMIQKICISLIFLLKESDIEKAREGLREVWQVLSKRNQLFITDIYLLNSILFYFPFETAKTIKDFIDRNIRFYKNNRELAFLQINISINFSLLLIKEKKYNDALKYIDESLIISKELRDILKIGICYVRKGVILSHLNIDLSIIDNLINKGLMFLEEIDDSNIIEIINKEIRTYKKSPT